MAFNAMRNEMPVKVEKLKVERDALGEKIIDGVTFLCSLEGVHLPENDFSDLKQQLVSMMAYHEMLVKRVRRGYINRGDS
mgnify:CR=1 FL=1